MGHWTGGRARHAMTGTAGWLRWGTAVAVLSAVLAAGAAESVPSLIVLPPGNAVRLSSGSTRSFSVTVTQENVAYRWTLDGKPVGNGRAFEYAAESADIGTHEITVTVVHGDAATRHAWRVTVDPPPVPTIVDVVPATPVVEGAPGEKVTFRYLVTSSVATDEVEVTWTIDGERAGTGATLAVPVAAGPARRVRAVANSRLGVVQAREWRLVARGPGAADEASPARPGEVEPDRELTALLRTMQPERGGGPPARTTTSTARVAARPATTTSTARIVMASPTTTVRVPATTSSTAPRVRTTTTTPRRATTTTTVRAAPVATTSTIAVARRPATTTTVARPVVTTTVPRRAAPTTTVVPRAAPTTTVALARVRPPAPPAPPPAPPAPPPAPSAPAPPPARAAGIAREEIVAFLERYARAYETRSVAELQRIGQISTASQAAALDRYFGQIRDLEVDVRVLDIRPRGDAVTVRYRRRDRFRDPTGRVVDKETPPIEKEIRRTPAGLVFSPSS